VLVAGAMGQGVCCVARSDWEVKQIEPESLIQEDTSADATPEAPDASLEAAGRDSATSASDEDLPLLLSSPTPQEVVELKPDEEKKYAELCGRLRERPEPETSEHCSEDRRRRLVRFLRGEAWNVEAAFKRIHEHALWWKAFGMDSFREEDELDERGPLFVCGEDACGRPTLVARPCVHCSKSREESVRAARRCVYTVWRCVQRYGPGVEKHDVIYDARGLSPRRNLDLVFVRELTDALSSHFPERVNRIVVINVHWTMQAFWVAVSPLLHPATKQRMTFCGSDFQGQLEGLVGPDHPYLRYALAVRGLSAREAAAVPLPPYTPFVPGQLEASNQGEGVESSPSRQSTAASETDIVDKYPIPAKKLA